LRRNGGKRKKALIIKRKGAALIKKWKKGLCSRFGGPGALLGGKTEFKLIPRERKGKRRIYKPKRKGRPLGGT